MFNTFIHRKGLVQQSLPPEWWPYRDPSLCVPCREQSWAFRDPSQHLGRVHLMLFFTTKNNNEGITIEVAAVSSSFSASLVSEV